MTKKQNVIHATIIVPPEANYDFKPPLERQWYNEAIQYHNNQIQEQEHHPIKEFIWDLIGGWGAAALFWRFFPTSLYTVMAGSYVYRKAGFKERLAHLHDEEDF